MSILWIYDQEIIPTAGGTERATYLVMSALRERRHQIAGFLVVHQGDARCIYDDQGRRVQNLYAFLKENDVHVVINQIGHSKWLLEEFLARGGNRWREEGGVIITCLHFDPENFSERITDLARKWNSKTPIQKVRRIGRIVMLPISKQKAKRTLREAYAYLLENSDHFVILSERHRRRLCEISRSAHRGERICVIPNPNTFSTTYSTDRLATKKKTVVIVSRLDEPQKRISLALLAWLRVMQTGEFDEWKLQIIGEGEYSEDYKQLVSSRRISNVEFVGRTDPESYFENASLYLHTARREGWGLTIVEAMQKGVVPIVMKSSAVFADIIDHGNNGVLTRDGDVKTFAAHVCNLMRNADRRYRMGVNAVRATLERDSEGIFEKWSRIVTRHSEKQRAA